MWWCFDGLLLTTRKLSKTIKQTQFSNIIKNSQNDRQHFSENTNFYKLPPNQIFNDQIRKNTSSEHTLSPFSKNLSFSKTRHSKTSAFYDDLYSIINIVGGHTAQLVLPGRFGGVLGNLKLESVFVAKAFAGALRQRSWEFRVVNILMHSWPGRIRRRRCERRSICKNCKMYWCICGRGRGPSKLHFRGLAGVPGNSHFFLNLF